ncbi:hypothetical protein BRADI_1g04970v3 [Brachypodium distachyon]|uniref:RNase H type-1 domain-containing protein n=1 Tax=Brachypodium distachyon TaxID=15368 RepID=A0A0Q3JKE4_BRADI|nr:hypothetical protein BRADI_1g04970v3 [Brachypodium distachyon]
MCELISSISANSLLACYCRRSTLFFYGLRVVSVLSWPRSYFPLNVKLWSCVVLLTHARLLWLAMSECWDIPVISAAEGASLDWIFSLLGRATPTQRTLLLLLLWPVWYVHNEFTHGKMPPAVLASQRYLQSYAESLIGLKLFPDADIRKGKQPVGIFTISPAKPASRPDEMIAWQTSCRWNVDGSFVSETGDTGAGMILHDHQGQVLFTAVRHLPACNDALESELAACMEGGTCYRSPTDHPSHTD